VSRGTHHVLSPTLPTLELTLMNATHPVADRTARLQAWLGHRNIQHTVRYTEIAVDRFRNFWRA
jgi:hypothetical protein